MKYLWNESGVLKVGGGEKAVYIKTGEEIPVDRMEKKSLERFIKSGQIMKVEYSAKGKKVLDENVKEIKDVKQEVKEDKFKDKADK